MATSRAGYRPTFKKPADFPWIEDKSDLDPNQGTSFIFNPNYALSYEQQRQRLPIFENRNHILYLLEKHQTLILVGETGCGKSTQVPQYLFESGWCEDGKLIGITEPRRVAATTLATRVAEEKGCILGGLVGYSIRFDDCFDPLYTRIKYMTEGILMREMLADPLLRHYSVIILDEVHERTLNTDIVMGLMKKILRKNKQLRLVVSSATVDAEQLKKFFSSGKDEVETAAILSIHGRLYPVDVHYISEPVPDYIQGVVDTCIKIHTSEGQGDVLAFLTGQEEVDKAVELLNDFEALPNRKKTALKMQVVPMYGALPNADQLEVFKFTKQGHRKIVIATNIAETSVTIPDIVYEPVPDYIQGVVDTCIKIHTSEGQGDVLAFLTGQEEVDKAVELLNDFEALPNRKKTALKMQVVPMYGALPNADQLEVFKFTKQGHRKIVIATNIAETSVTIPDIVYVVDSGFVKLRWFNTSSLTDALVVVPVSQASADQRAGRAGRVRPGKAYRLYTEEEYLGLSAATTPEMQRSELSGAVLQLMALGIE
ncbi:hypothetical protein B566_EDAN004860 [Ephemera danica]|nr:hypothetical protein B566_EDAN004860 [Ephemera danica]